MRECGPPAVVAAVVFQELFASAGLVFGWPVLRSLLLAEGVYAELCPDGDECTAQQLALHRIYTVGSFGAIFAGAGLGPLLDLLGPRALHLGCLGVYAAGMALLAAAAPAQPGLFAPALLLVGIGGVGTLLCGFAVCGESGSRHTKIMMGTVGCAFDASPLVLMAWAALHGAGWHRRTIVLAHAVFGLPAATAITLLVYPRRAADHAVSAAQAPWQRSAKTPAFAGIALLFAFGVVKFNFHIANLAPMLEQVGAMDLLPAFAVLFPLAGVVGPAIGYLFDLRRPRAAVAVMIALSLAHTATAAATARWVQYLSFFCLGLHRSATYGGLPQFITALFPQRHFGKLMGIATFWGGAATFLEYGLTAYVVTEGGRAFRAVFLAFAAATVLLFAFPALVRLELRDAQKGCEAKETGNGGHTVAGEAGTAALEERDEVREGEAHV